MIVIHYHRFDSDYDGLAMWTWDKDDQRNPDTQDLLPAGWDDFGPYFQVDAEKYGISDYHKTIGFVIRRHGDWGRRDGRDRFWTPDMGKHIWLIGGDNCVYTERPDTSPHVSDAWVDGTRLLFIHLSHGIDLGRLVPSSVQLRSAAGQTINVTSIRALDAQHGKAHYIEVTLERDVPLGQSLAVLLNGYRPATARLRRLMDDGYLFYDDKELGAICSPSSTTFRFFSPMATNASVQIYTTATATEPINIEEMRNIGKGIWEVSLPGDFHGRYYRYRIEFDGFAPPHEVVDINARCTSGHDGHGLIVDLRRTDPKGFRPINRPKSIQHPTDAVIWEVSIRDFTRHASSGVAEAERGKFLGAASRGTMLPYKSQKTGIDHLVELGVTHVQVLFVHDFNNREDSDEYNWGYMTSHFNSPDGWFASNRRDESRIREFKQVVKAFHDAGIRVVMDVVYNHTAPNAGFEFIAPGYYLRLRDDGSPWNGSGCGNEFRSEAPMARKFILDSCRYWVEEFGVDGFRFDLMGLVDLQTMLELKRELAEIDPTLLLYGEPWAAAGQEDVGLNPITYKHRVAWTGVGAFNDHFRNDLKGKPDGSEPGYVHFGIHREGVMKGLLGSIHDWAGQPGEVIQYATCHDNLTLYDKSVLCLPNESTDTHVKIQMLTAGILAVSQGVMFLHGGHELLRSKQGNHNSYNAPDLINWIDWSRKERYNELFEFVRGMIAIRRAHPIFRLRTREEIEKRIAFIQPPVGHDSSIIMRLDGSGLEGETWSTVIVAINPDSHDRVFPLPEGPWQLYAQGIFASVEPMLKVYEMLPVPARSLAIVVK